MRFELKSIGLWGFIKVSVFVNLVLGFIAGLFYGLFLWVFMTLFQGLGNFPLEEFDGAEISGVVLIFVFPIVFSIGGAVFGTLWGLVCVVIYNLVARLVGGLEFDFAEIKSDQVMAPIQQPITTYTSSLQESMPAPPPTEPPRPPVDNSSEPRRTDDPDNSPQV